VPARPTPAADVPTRAFADQQAWDKWLAANHAGSRGLWLRLAKAGAARKTLSYAEALEVALAWGWIDGQKRSQDDAYWLQKFTPRGPRSVWSKINRDKAERLIEEGRMHPAGLAAVAAARKDGRWDAAYDSPRTATVPDDLRDALERRPRAAAFFTTLDSANRYAILFHVHHAKKAETRARRIEKFVGMLERGDVLHPERSRRPRAAGAEAPGRGGEPRAAPTPSRATSARRGRGR
jgi:uncharacterized protein YdeI (YjbR/CyaY-like superfamily)